ncbi:hypothetical protein MMC22_007610 [Lobaria immixta]|nr:hypothetical protein [Lobaria immixta]
MKGNKRLTIVIKLGSSSIVDEKTREPLLSVVTLIVETAVKLRQDGHRVVIVSSGAIAVGLRRMGVGKKPKYLPTIQALAAVGQCRLIALWDSLFAHLQQPIAQILLTRNDIADRTQYRNAQNTFTELLNMGVIPIVNENDTLAVSEIKFGDNDTLSAITAGMVQADYLFLMTDVDCLYDKNPRTHADAQPIKVVEDISSLAADVSTSGSALGTGGMSTKIVAARLATSAGVTTVITRSSNPGNILDIVRHDQAVVQTEADSAQDRSLSSSLSSLHFECLPKPPLHTRFLPDLDPIRDRSFWLLHGLAAHGTIYIDEGAHRALISKAGLLPAGIVDVEGKFAQQEAVRIVVVLAGVSRPDPATSTPSAQPPLANSTSRSSSPQISDRFDKSKPVLVEVGRALVNYSAKEIARIKGLQSTEILGVLGYADSDYVALRSNVSLMKRERTSRPVTPSPAGGN